MHIPPPVPFAAAWLTQRLLSRRKKGAPERKVPAVAKLAAVGVAGVSATMMAGTFAQYRLGDTTVDPTRPDRTSALIVTGPNRITRNPIYVGFAGLLTAHALWRGSVSSLLPVAGFMAAVTPQIEQEEDALMTSFGRGYARYVKRVPRWLGRLG